MKKFLRWLKGLWHRFKEWDYIECTYRREVSPPVREPRAKVRVHEVAAALPYPVDPNSRWAFYRLSDQTIVRHNVRWPRADGMEIVGLDADIIPLLEVDEPLPVYDSATQKLERSTPVVDVNANTHTHGWEVVPRTQEELDSEAELTTVKALYAALKAHSGTADERATRLENVVAYLLKDQYGAS